MALAANTFNVAAGTESGDTTVQVNAYAPNSIRVNVGDTVTWTIQSTEFHTVSFLGGAAPPDFVQAGPDGVFINPQAAFPTPGTAYNGQGVASSGLITKGQTWSLTFTQPGTYGYVCMVHPFMQGTVNVAPAGQPADAPAAVAARGDAQSNRDIATKGVAALASHSGEMLIADMPASSAGSSDPSGVAFIPRFLPNDLVVHQGDTVTWLWGDPFTPHTVTFLADQQPPDLIVPQPQPGGPPRLSLNPQVLMPAGDPSNYAGGFLNSGFIDPPMLPPGQAAYAVTFAQPGSYSYLCLLHEGMMGTVTVLP
jgi:plastocyanin